MEDLMRKLILPLTLVSLMLAGCGDDEATTNENSSTGITISGQISTGSALLSSEKEETLGLDQYTFYCVAFNSSADSCSDQLDSNGNFSCSGLPADTPFGCFVKDSTSVVATLQFADSSGSGFDDETSFSAKVKESLSLGTVTLNTTTGKATANKSVLDGKTSTGDSNRSPADYQNTSWSLDCVNGDDNEQNTNCAQFTTDSPTVYFRVLTATKGSETMYGLGVWKNKDAFDGCGEIDMTTAMKTSIESESGVSFTSVAYAGTFTADHGGGGTCPTDDGNAPSEPGDIKNYYAMEKLIENGGSYTMYEEEVDSQDAGCIQTHNLAVTFNPVSDTVMYGAFDIVEKHTGESCGTDEEDKSAKFTVKFTKS